MTMDEYFKSLGNASAIFDPIPTFDGDWIFMVDNLIKNGKKENGVNLFSEFYKKTYQNPLEKIFDTKGILDLTVGMVSTPNDNNIGRCLKYSKIDFYISLSGFLNHAIDRYGKTKEEQNSYLCSLIDKIKIGNEEVNLAFSDALKIKSNKLKDLLAKEINSEYFDAAMQDYAPYKNYIDFTTYIKRSSIITDKFQSGMLRLGDFFDYKIDFEEMKKAFDPDIFYLLFAKIIYEFNLIREKETGKLDNSYCYLCRYQDALKEVVSSDKKYNPHLNFILPSGKKERLSRWEMQAQIKELLERHPEAKMIKLLYLEGDNIKNVDFMNKMASLYSDEIKTLWEFLPEGNKIKRNESVTKRQLNNSNNKNKTKEELINETNMRIDILENSGFLGRPIKGLDTFTGYYAFVYANGKIILEKFWENVENMTPQRYNATYVMSIDNFIEMSKIPKLNLIEYMKNLPSTGVKRIFHTTIDNWQKNLYKEIEGTYRIEDAINFINALKSGEPKK